MNANNNFCNTSQYTYLTISLLITIGLLVLSAVLSSTASAFDPNATKYELIKIWGSKGTGDGQFQRPHDLDFGQAENYLYTVDRDGNRIQVFDKNGTILFKWGKLGTGDGAMHVAYGIDIDISGNLWLADRANHRIQEFDYQGKFIMKFGSKGSVLVNSIIQDTSSTNSSITPQYGNVVGITS